MTAIDEGEHPGTPRRKHRHDLGQEDHGPKLAASTTRAIQTLLGIWIALTVLLLVYAFVDSVRPGEADQAGRGDLPEAGAAGAAGVDASPRPR